jgi:hypothetical protein
VEGVRVNGECDKENGMDETENQNQVELNKEVFCFFKECKKNW